MKHLVLAALVPLLVLVGVGAGGGVDFPPDSRDTAVLMLRLSDVPGGYLIDSDTGCGTGVENAPPALANLIIAHLPEHCGIYFKHRRRLRSILGDVFVFRSPEAAAALFAARRELFTYTTGLERPTEHPHAGPGDEARLFRLQDALLSGPDVRRPGAAVFWRRGAMLGFVLVTQASAGRSLRLARRLAFVQDGRMRTPTPIPPAENDDVEVPLGDPGLGVSVQWLGRRFAPGRGLAPLQLEYTYGPDHPQDGLPSPRARMEYEAVRPRTYGVDLELWRPRHWRTFSGADLGRRVLGSRCARAAKKLQMRGGRAVIYAGCANSAQGALPVAAPRRVHRPRVFQARGRGGQHAELHQLRRGSDGADGSLQLRQGDDGRGSGPAPAQSLAARSRRPDFSSHCEEKPGQLQRRVDGFCPCARETVTSGMRLTRVAARTTITPAPAYRPWVAAPSRPGAA